MRTVSLQTPQMPESGDGLVIVSSLSAKGSHLFNSLMYKILPNFKLFIKILGLYNLLCFFIFKPQTSDKFRQEMIYIFL